MQWCYYALLLFDFAAAASGAAATFPIPSTLPPARPFAPNCVATGAPNSTDFSTRVVTALPAMHGQPPGNHPPASCLVLFFFLTLAGAALARARSASHVTGVAVRWTLLAAAFTGRCTAQTAMRPSLVTTIVGGAADATSVSSKFTSPYAVAVDTRNILFVADNHNYRIFKVTPSGVLTTLAGQSTAGFFDAIGTSAQFSGPHGVAVDLSSNVIVADTYNHRIRIITPGGAVTTLAGSTQGFSDDTGTSARFRYPHGVAVDSSNNVIVADTYNHCIRKITPSGLVTTLAGQSSAGVLDAIGTNARFEYPQGVAVDSSIDVIVADTGNHRIRKVSSGGVVTTLAGQSSGRFDAIGTSAMFTSPVGVAVDASGSIVVADRDNYCIRKVTPVGAVTTLAGIHSETGLGNDGTVASAAFFFPSGVAIDSSGSVLVADNGNRRIRLLSAPSLCPSGFFCGQCATELSGVCPCPAGSY